MTRVVDFGFGVRLRTRVRMRLTFGGEHSAVPYGAVCLMVLGLCPTYHMYGDQGRQSVTPDKIASGAHSTIAGGL